MQPNKYQTNSGVAGTSASTSIVTAIGIKIAAVTVTVNVAAEVDLWVEQNHETEEIQSNKL